MGYGAKISGDLAPAWSGECKASILFDRIRGRALKRMKQLRDIGLWQRFVDSILGWQLVVRHMRRAEYHVEHRQLTGEILVTRHAVIAVMPVMEFR